MNIDVNLILNLAKSIYGVNAYISNGVVDNIDVIDHNRKDKSDAIYHAANYIKNRGIPVKIEFLIKPNDK